MLTTKTGAGAGPINTLLAIGRGRSRFLNLASCRKKVTAPALLGVQPSDVSDDVWSIAWSGDANYLVAQYNLGTRFLKRTGYTFSGSDAQSDPAGVGACALSTDGAFVATQTRTSPFARIWHNNAGTLTTLSIGTVAAGNSVALTSDGSYAAFYREDAPFLQIKKRSGNGNAATFADIVVSTQPALGTTSQSGQVAFSSDNQFIAVLNRSGGFAFYKFNSSTGLYDSHAVTISGSSPSEGHGLAWSADGTWLAAASSSGTILYKFDGATLTAQASLSGGYAGSFHPLGTQYITGSGLIYKKSTDTVWPLALNLGSSPYSLSSAYASAFSPLIA
jgi:WD40 repeat protein